MCLHGAWPLGTVVETHTREVGGPRFESWLHFPLQLPADMAGGQQQQQGLPQRGSCPYVDGVCTPDFVSVGVNQ